MKFSTAAALFFAPSVLAFAPAQPAFRPVTSLKSTEAAAETKAFAKLPASVKPGVVTGQALVDLLQHAKKEGFAIPGVNIVGSNSINACMEAAAKYGGPIMITFSKGGGAYIAGKTLKNENDSASVAGCIAGAKHVREVAKLYGVPVVLHTDHCQKSWLPWIDQLMDANEAYFKEHGEPLFSSHMLDLSEEPLEENIAICKKYLERMAKCNVLLEFELGVTGGEEDGVDNSDVDNDKLYTQPEEVYYAYKELGSVPNGHFTCAASFGNVHGVYAPGNVELRPIILHNTQKYIQEKEGCEDTKPMMFVFHGGSGSSTEDIQYAIEAGVIKMNIDTDTQWAFWDGMREYEAKYHDYLQGQIGNPEGPDKPNKKYYDPRMPLRAGEEAMANRLVKAAQDLNCVNVLN
ncbi:fructose-bisphosphate aldolase, class II [Fistulifera solaris]|uniref:fructose-bisphosphate aldolase n=1 Tax=Fistulifera solaris TaxID=1519565 RepID=A0A1Z5KRQ2_FISSO|nr:fructose-bisphosphate aldolase, class II [Fistulifera solaris]|eukprot:GAX29000.1 fructose-bisphosphate aldolase, class II [Fistulifera solaris]